LALARILTRFTGDAYDIVARCGVCGVYSAVGEVFPRIVRAGARDGVSEVELNKVLQVGPLNLIVTDDKQLDSHFDGFPVL
jgi:hypothetical protein